MSDFVAQKSLWGRQLAISTTGGLVSAVGSTGARNSTSHDMFYEQMGKAVFETLSTDGSNIANSGVSIFSTDSTSGSTHFLLAPVQGFKKEVYFQTSATAIGIDTTGAGIIINTTLAESAAGGSSSITIVGAAAGIGGSLVLRGLGSTSWQVVSATVTVSS